GRTPRSPTRGRPVACGAPLRWASTAGAAGHRGKNGAAPGVFAAAGAARPTTTVAPHVHQALSAGSVGRRTKVGGPICTACADRGGNRLRRRRPGRDASESWNRLLRRGSGAPPQPYHVPTLPADRAIGCHERDGSDRFEPPKPARTATDRSKPT